MRLLANSLTGACVVNASRTAPCTTENTSPSRRNRTSALPGCTLTSTSSNGTFSLINAIGNRRSGNHP